MFRYFWLGIVLGLSCCSVPIFSFLLYWTFEDYNLTLIYLNIGMTSSMFYLFIPFFFYKFYPLSEHVRKMHTPVIYIAWFVLGLQWLPFALYLWPGIWLILFFAAKVLNYVELLEDSEMLSFSHPEEMEIITAGKCKMLILCIFLGIIAHFAGIFEYYRVFVESLSMR